MEKWKILRNAVVVILAALVMTFIFYSWYSVPEVKPLKKSSLVALIDIESNEFFCSGHLISKNHLLSAAHCIHEKADSHKLEPDKILAVTGKLDLNEKQTIKSAGHEVVKILIHPDWKFNEKEFDADIAILTLKNFVELTKEVFHIFIPQVESVSDSGKILGYSRKDDNYALSLDELELKTHSFAFCSSTFQSLKKNLSARTFCAGYESNGKNVCFGKSGGGFYNMGKSGWELTGIASTSLASFSSKCDDSEISIYTSIAKYSSWIEENQKL